MKYFMYRRDKTKIISFPLGGIGTGCIGLAGNGRLIDWEIYNRPNKGSVNGFSHFAVKAESNGEVLDARILNADLRPPYLGEGNSNISIGNMGFGPRREYLAGLPHFSEVDFLGEFPIAELTFKDNKFPGCIQMTAFNPFIPLNERDSGIPAAFFEIEVKNTTKKNVDYTIACTLANPLPANNLDIFHEFGKVCLLHLKSDAYKPNDVNYGDLCLATDAADVSRQEYWFHGGRFGKLEVYWRDFTTPGKFKNRSYSAEKAGCDNHGIIAAHVSIEPGQTERVRFVISWNFPNCDNYWKKENACDCSKKSGVPSTWKNHYATIWKDSQAGALYALENWDRLVGETFLFKNALFSSSLPPAAIDAVSANISTLKSPTVLRLEDGTFYGWEGCHPSAGCCRGSCTHVWNYAQALPFLFPNLERSMRKADYKYNQQTDGGMRFRLELPLGVKHPGEVRSCADGLFGGVMKVYRDWKICGDTSWLQDLWPAIKTSIEFAWNRESEDKWDPEKTGVLWGRQHHTLDMELFGPNSWLTGFYLGALKAGAEMAEHLGETETASLYKALFGKGKAWTDKNLFNGKYYKQLIDLKDKNILKKYKAMHYWNDEHKEIKAQIGDGCALDQVLAQWHANLYGLGEIFDKKQTKKALKSVFKYNFKKAMRDYCNFCRIYSLNDEAGLVICDWPEGAYRPVIPLNYAQETMNGFEYAAAVQMIQTGLVKEGMIAIEAIRDRYDGERRNPWNEFECGSNYARSMASYSLLNAFAGFQFDMVRGMIGFDPVKPESGKFRCFWSLDSGWGEYEMKPGTIEIRILYGELWLNTLNLPSPESKKVRTVSVDGKPAAFEQKNGEICFTRTTHIVKEQRLRVHFV